MRNKFFIAGVISSLGLLAGCRLLPNPGSTLYPTQGECERATGKTCSFQQCDYVPLGKTVEEVCGGNFGKGWVPGSQPAPSADWGSYTSYGLGPAFRLDYPRTWAVVEGPDVQGVNRYVGTPVVQVKTPAGYQLGTNLAEASATVSESADPSAVANCVTRVEDLQLQLVSRPASTGLPWASAAHVGAAAGSRYEQTIYRLRSGDACIEVLTTIQSANLGNYNPGTVTEFDHAAVAGLLQQIVERFQIVSNQLPLSG